MKHLDEREVRQLHISLKQEGVNAIASDEYEDQMDFLTRKLAETMLRLNDLEEEKP